MNLPNLHPAVVHFPIALWLAAVLFDVACLMIRRHRWIDLTATSLYAMGALGAGAAYLAGEWAEDSLIDLPASLETLVEDHSDWAWWTLIVFAVVAALRLVILRVDRGVGHRLTGVRWLVLLAALGGTWALVETADRGGALVYRHGVAVTPANAGADAARAPASTAMSAPSAPSAQVPAPSAPPAQVPARPAAPASPVIRGADGTLVWMPGPDDSAQLGAILTNAVGSDPAVVTAETIPPSSGAPAGPGINLR
ncbi:MAG TPA: DUF2231 domain-containing protein, partial [Patescibacteria group bacterium]|nr:DUF2231 domain-containing protein [Patescibacteria group bacterium]